jgi:hypothetical protein
MKTRVRSAWLWVAWFLSGCNTGWTEPLLVETGTPDPTRFFYFAPKVAASGRVLGTATAVWTSRLTELHGSRLGISWSAPAPLGAHRAFRNAHAVSVAPDGSALALFSSESAIRASRYDGTTWAPSVVVDDSGTWPSIGTDRNGSMIGVWTNGTRARSARYAVGSGWQPAESLGAEAVSVTSTDVAVSPAGYAVAAWCERRKDGSSCVVANRYVPTAGWTGATDLGSVPACLVIRGSWADFAPDPATVDTAISELNVPNVLWTNGTAQFQRWTRLPDGTFGWLPPRALSSGVDVIHPRIAVNRDGDALLAWQTYDTNEVQATRYGVEFDRWGPTVTIAPSVPRPPNLEVGMDSNQRGMVAFLDSRQRVTVRRYDGASFEPALAISDIGSYEFDMVMTADGQACAVWASRQIDVLSAVFTP